MTDFATLLKNLNEKHKVSPLKKPDGFFVKWYKRCFVKQDDEAQKKLKSQFNGVGKAGLQFGPKKISTIKKVIIISVNILLLPIIIPLVLVVKLFRKKPVKAAGFGNVFRLPTTK
jgi:hypothetical protein